MCTVSFLPVNGRYLITSNRDEKNTRQPALPPQVYNMGDSRLLYPKDPDAGGSWIGLNNRGDAAVLLNGGFVNHVPKPVYRKSRGLAFLEILSSRKPLNAFFLANLEEVQPFTLVIFSQKNLCEYRWDGSRKYDRVLPAAEPHIWSSVTLYDASVIAKRQSWFAEWLLQNPAPGQPDIFHFHRFAGDGDPVNDLLMNRYDHLFTVSITGMEIGTDRGLMIYQDLLTGNEYSKYLSFAEQTSIV